MDAKIAIFNEDAADYGTYNWKAVVNAWNAMLPAVVDVYNEDDSKKIPMRMKVTSVGDTDMWQNGDAYHPLTFTLEEIVYGPFEDGLDPSDEFSPTMVEFMSSVSISDRDMHNQVYAEGRGDCRYFYMTELLEKLAPKIIDQEEQETYA